MTPSKLLRAALAVAIPVMVGGLWGGAASAQSTAPKGPVVFIEGTTNNIRSVNPLVGLETPEYEIYEMNYNQLLNFDRKTLGPAPGLADKLPEQSSDGLTWTFHIRSGVKWQDGQPFTAADAAFTYNLILKDQVGNFLNYLPHIDSITAPNDSTLIWKTDVPTVAPLYPPWIYILPEHIWSKLTKSEVTTSFKNFYPDDPRSMVGTGPFHMTKWDKGQSWTLEANKDYWGGKPHIDQFIVKLYNNPEALVNALKQGEVDYVGANGGFTADLFDSLKGTPGITTHVGPLDYFDQLSMNQCAANPGCKPVGTGHPALLDVTVRRAIEMAIDKKALVDQVFHGYANVGTSITPPDTSAYWHWNPPADVAIPDGDLAGANKVLDDAGYKDTNGDGIREMPRGGKPLDFRFILRAESPEGQAMGQFIAGWLKEIGIKTRTEVVTDNKLVNAWYANDYDLYIWGWGPDPDPDFILSTFIGSQCGNWSDTCYNNDQYNAMYASQQVQTSLESRKAVVDQMQEHIYTQIPEVVLAYPNELEAYRSDRWTGFVQMPAKNGLLWGQYVPYSSLSIRPATGTTGTEKGQGGISAGVWIGILAGILVIVAAVMLLRRRGPEEDRA